MPKDLAPLLMIKALAESYLEVDAGEKLLKHHQPRKRRQRLFVAAEAGSDGL